MSENRRKYIRIDSGNAPCTLQINGAAASAELANESIFGLCVGGIELMLLAADQPVTILYENEQIKGRCKSVSRDENGKFQIGIQKTDDDKESDRSLILVNTYMNFGGYHIVCLPIEMLPDDQVRIRLLDGKEFIVNRDQMIQFTRQEREANLRHPGMLQEILGIYTALNDNRCWYGESDILNHEFGYQESAVLTR